MKRICLLLCLALLCFAATAHAKSQSLTLMTHDSFNISKEVLADFEKKNDVTIRILKAGDAGEALTQAILSKNNPMADVFYGIDNTFLSRALDQNIFEPYDSPELKNVFSGLKLDARNRLLPVDFGDVCLNYDKKWFAEKGMTPPADLKELIDPIYSGLTVVENPATSSPGLAFMLATIGAFGEEGWLDWWAQLRDNKVAITDGWKEAYWGKFTAASKGDRPIVVSYASSPPVEVLFAETKLDEAPTAAITAPKTCFRQIEFIGILKGTKNRKLAEIFIDFLLSKTFQEDIPLKMFVYPANKNAKLPRIFTEHSTITNDPATVPASDINNNRERWIQEWTETMIR